MNLPININQPLHGKVFIWERFKFSSGWYRKVILHCLYVLANDSYNFDVGYVIVKVRGKTILIEETA